MSVIITTLESLPKFCDNCPCYHVGYCKADKWDRETGGEYRPYWCPLQEEKKQKYGFESYNIIGTAANN